MKKSTSADSTRGGSGGSRSSSKCSSAGEVKTKPSSASASGSGKAKPSSASSETNSNRVGRPSDVLNPKTCDPFSGKKSTSAFVSVYSNGGIPCRLVHGSVKHRLQWSTPVDKVSFDPVLVALAEGLKETVHPYAFVARQGFVELLEAPNASAKAMTVLPKLITPIRNSLAHQDDKVFTSGLDALTALSNAVTASLNHHLKQFLVPLAKRLTEACIRDAVVKTLQALETNGGKEATTIIKSKIPTYNSVVHGPG